MYPEAFSKKIGGDKQQSPDEIPLKIIKKDKGQLTFLTPQKKGAYRIFAIVKNEKGQCSVANIPFLVK